MQELGILLCFFSDGRRFYLPTYYFNFCKFFKEVESASKKDQKLGLVRQGLFFYAKFVLIS